MTLVVETSAYVRCPLCDYRSPIRYASANDIEDQIAAGIYKCPACGDGHHEGWSQSKLPFGPYGVGAKPEWAT